MTLENNIPKDVSDSISSVLGQRASLNLRRVIRVEIRPDKLEPKALVLSDHRLYIFANKSPSRLELSIHFLDLIGIQSSDNKLTFTTEVRKLKVFLRDATDVDHIVCQMADSLLQTFPHLSLESLVGKLEISPPDRLKKLTEQMKEKSTKRETGPCGNFSAQYRCMCDFHNMPFLDEVAWDVDTIYLALNNKALVLSDFDHLDGKHLVPIIATMAYNNWFTTLCGCDVRLVPEAQTEFANVTRTNTSIEHYCVMNCGLKSDFVQKLSPSLAANVHATAISHLLFNGNHVEDKGLLSLCPILSDLPKGATSLQFAKCNLTQKGVNKLAEALINNTFMLTSLRELDLSGNTLRDDVTNLYNFLATPNALVTLNLSGTECALDNIFGALIRGCCNKLEELDLSSNVFSSAKKKVAESMVPVSWKQFFASAVSMKKVSLADNKLPIEAIKNLLLGISSNENLREVALDLSNNNLGIQGGGIVETCMTQNTNITDLDISDNNLEGYLAKLLESLATNTSLKKLAIGKNFNNLKARQMQAVLEAVVTIMQEEDSALESLSLADSKLKADTAVVINALGGNTKLTELDISGNLMGDMGVRLLAKALHINNRLRVIRWDCNNTLPQGFSDVAYALQKNFTVQQMPIPVQDLPVALRVNREKTEKAIHSIESSLQRNNSPRRCVSEQAYRLQQSFLVSTTQEVVDGYIVGLLESIGTLERRGEELSSDVRRDIAKARALMKDAENSRQLLVQLQKIGSKCEDDGSDVTRKLNYMTDDLQVTLEKYLKNSVADMMKVAQGRCTFLMQDQAFTERVKEECLGKAQLPGDFSQSVLVHQAGPDMYNKLNPETVSDPRKLKPFPMAVGIEEVSKYPGKGYIKAWAEAAKRLCGRDQSHLTHFVGEIVGGPVKDDSSDVNQACRQMKKAAENIPARMPLKKGCIKKTKVPEKFVDLQRYRAGDVVLHMYRGKWWPARVEGRDPDGSIEVSFCGFDFAEVNLTIAFHISEKLFEALLEALNKVQKELHEHITKGESELDRLARVSIIRPKGETAAPVETKASPTNRKSIYSVRARPTSHVASLEVSPTASGVLSESTDEDLDSFVFVDSDDVGKDSSDVTHHSDSEAAPAAVTPSSSTPKEPKSPPPKKPPPPKVVKAPSSQAGAKYVHQGKDFKPSPERSEKGKSRDEGEGEPSAPPRRKHHAQHAKKDADSSLERGSTISQDSTTASLKIEASPQLIAPPHVTKSAEKRQPPERPQAPERPPERPGERSSVVGGPKTHTAPPRPPPASRPLSGLSGSFDKSTPERPSSGHGVPSEKAPAIPERPHSQTDKPVIPDRPSSQVDKTPPKPDRPVSQTERPAKPKRTPSHAEKALERAGSQGEKAPVIPERPPPIKPARLSAAFQSPRQAEAAVQPPTEKPLLPVSDTKTTGGVMKEVSKDGQIVEKQIEGEEKEDNTKAKAVMIATEMEEEEEEEEEEEKEEKKEEPERKKVENEKEKKQETEKEKEDENEVSGSDHTPDLTDSLSTSVDSLLEESKDTVPSIEKSSPKIKPGKKKKEEKKKLKATVGEFDTVPALGESTKLTHLTKNRPRRMATAKPSRAVMKSEAYVIEDIGGADMDDFFGSKPVKKEVISRENSSHSLAKTADLEPATPNDEKSEAKGKKVGKPLFGGIDIFGGLNKFRKGSPKSPEDKPLVRTPEGVKKSQEPSAVEPASRKSPVTETEEEKEEAKSDVKPLSRRPPGAMGIPGLAGPSFMTQIQQKRSTMLKEDPKDKPSEQIKKEKSPQREGGETAAPTAFAKLRPTGRLNSAEKKTEDIKQAPPPLRPRPPITAAKPTSKPTGSPRTSQTKAAAPPIPSAAAPTRGSAEPDDDSRAGSDSEEKPDYSKRRSSIKDRIALLDRNRNEKSSSSSTTPALTSQAGKVENSPAKFSKARTRPFSSQSSSSDKEETTSSRPQSMFNDRSRLNELLKRDAEKKSASVKVGHVTENGKNNGKDADEESASKAGNKQFEVYL